MNIINPSKYLEYDDTKSVDEISEDLDVFMETVTKNHKDLHTYMEKVNKGETTLENFQHIQSNLLLTMLDYQRLTIEYLSLFMLGYELEQTERNSP